jgi:CPA1 family monovalent cation:H+ antiporter
MGTSFAFLLIGLKADFGLLVAYSPFIIAAFLAIIVARVISVYPIIGLAKMMRENIPHSWTRIVAFAGLRGAVSIALALSLPETRFKDEIVAMTFGVALLSLVVQAEVMQFYVRNDKLISSGQNEQRPDTRETPVPPSDIASRIGDADNNPDSSPHSRRISPAYGHSYLPQSPLLQLQVAPE